MDLELGVKNMEVVPQSALAKRLPALETRKLFQSVKEYIKNEFGKEVVFSEHDGLHFDIENLKVHPELHVLDDPSNLVSLSYGLFTYEDGQSYEQANFQVVVEENSRTVIKKVASNFETKAIEIYASETIDGDLDTAWQVIDNRNKKGLLEDLRNDPVAINEGISTQGIFDFCLAGGYQYCGKGCGSCTGCDGGEYIKNKIDGCCVIHDDCYRRYSSNRCANCDRELIRCVNVDVNRREGIIASDAITLFFAGKCGYVV